MTLVAVDLVPVKETTDSGPRAPINTKSQTRANAVREKATNRSSSTDNLALPGTRWRAWSGRGNYR